MESDKILESKYREVLEEYLGEQTESTLYSTQILSKELLENKITPEEIVSLHKALLAELIPSIPKKVLTSFDILLEVMMAYGLTYRENESLRFKQTEIRNELEIGAHMQKVLLGTNIPKSEYLDIGAISKPAKIMNGDYFQFLMDSKQNIRVVIADVIGKGIPAALCMLMIKHAVDSYSAFYRSPEFVLEDLNQTVEKNMEQGMFITMLYGSYDPHTHIFQYASAGHEPGFYYSQKDNSFSDLPTKGLILGIDSKASYRKFEKKVELGDMIILLSDGVTETKVKNDFIEREQITGLIEKYKHLPAQDIVNHVYEELEKIQQYQLRDDFTLIILRRVV